MKLNIFIVLISFMLLTILLVFKPLDIKQQKFIDVPQFKLLSFTMYELDTNGLVTLMSGTRGTKYATRYVVHDIDYTDNSKEYVANMTANHGVYKNEIVKLKGDVKYVREDGLIFKSQEATHNKKTGISHTDGKFTIYQNDSVVHGTKLVYNNIKDKIKAKKIDGIYQLKEGKQ